MAHVLESNLLRGVGSSSAPNYRASLMPLLAFTTAPLMGSRRGGVVRRMLSAFDEIAYELC